MPTYTTHFPVGSVIKFDYPGKFIVLESKGDRIILGDVSDILNKDSFIAFSFEPDNYDGMVTVLGRNEEAFQKAESMKGEGSFGDGKYEKNTEQT